MQVFHGALPPSRLVGQVKAETLGMTLAEPEKIKLFDAPRLLPVLTLRYFMYDKGGKCLMYFKDLPHAVRYEAAVACRQLHW